MIKREIKKVGEEISHHCIHHTVFASVSAGNDRCLYMW